MWEVLRETVGLALDTMSEQRQAVAAGADAEDAYQQLTERVAALAAMSRQRCPRLAELRPAGEPAGFTAEQWTALHAHVGDCVLCKPRDPRRLREQVEWLAPGLALPPEEDPERRWLSWLNSPKADTPLLRPFARVLKAAVEALNKLDPTWTTAVDPQVVKAVAGVVGLLIAGVVALVSSAPHTSGSIAEAQPQVSAIPGLTTSPTTGPTGSGPATTPAPPTPTTLPASTAEPPPGHRPPPSEVGGAGAGAGGGSGGVGGGTGGGGGGGGAEQREVTVDVTGTDYLAFAVSGGTTWTNARQPRALRLAEGNHLLHIYGGPSFLFRVTAAGTVDYEAALDSVLIGRGTRNLRTNGRPIRFNLLETSHSSFSLSGVTGWTDARQIRTYRMLPGRHLIATYPSNTIRIDVTHAGTVTYDASLNGAFAGGGTAELRVVGVPVTIDARNIGDSVFSISGIWGWQDPAQPRTYRMMPGSHYLGDRAGKTVPFRLSPTGIVDYDAADIYSGRGTRTLVVRRPF